MYMGIGDFRGPCRSRILLLACVRVDIGRSVAIDARMLEISRRRRRRRQVHME